MAGAVDDLTFADVEIHVFQRMRMGAGVGLCDLLEPDHLSVMLLRTVVTFVKAAGRTGTRGAPPPPPPCGSRPPARPSRAPSAPGPPLAPPPCPRPPRTRPPRPTPCTTPPARPGRSGGRWRRGRRLCGSVRRRRPGRTRPRRPAPGEG